MMRMLFRAMLALGLVLPIAAQAQQKLSAAAPTMSNELHRVIPDATGAADGLLVFNKTPTIVTPTISGTVTSSGSNLGLVTGTLIDGNLPVWSGTTGTMADSGIAPTLLSVAQMQSLIMPAVILGGKRTAANFNSTADQSIAITSPTASYIVDRVVVTNPSTSLTTAAGGLYSGASKSGVTLVDAATTYAGLTTGSANTTGNAAHLTNTAAANTTALNVGSIFLSLSTPQGGTATADVRVYIRPLY